MLGCLAGENFVCAVRKKFFTPDAMVFIVEYFFLFWLKKLKKCWFHGEVALFLLFLMPVGKKIFTRFCNGFSASVCAFPAPWGLGGHVIGIWDARYGRGKRRGPLELEQPAPAGQ